MKKKSKDIEPIIQEGIKEALAIAKEVKLKFDFSDKSIKAVEKLLGEVHKEYKKTGEEEGLSGLALMLAAYIGEVIRKKGFGGEWSRDHPIMGKYSYPFYWHGHELFIYEWCIKRIVDGKGDDVWFKYKVLVLDKIKKKRLESSE
jgi:hypothetical protein